MYHTGYEIGKEPAVDWKYWAGLTKENPNMKEEIEYWRDFCIAYPEALKEMRSFSSFNDPDEVDNAIAFNDLYMGSFESLESYAENWFNDVQSEYDTDDFPFCCLDYSKVWDYISYDYDFYEGNNQFHIFRSL